MTRKLLDIRFTDLNAIIGQYIAHKQRDALDALPKGPLKARWDRYKKELEEKEKVEDISMILKVKDFFASKKNVKDEGEEIH